ncbi:MAG TPA: fumarylacetoacetate hydrolase family protein [Fodinibius sp.]|nr:fumarylacetoacetate hydrolase family protein [Fodinibius sp.]
MKLTTLKDGTPVVISNNRSIPLADLGFKGTLMELIQSGKAKLDNLRQKLDKHADSGQEVSTEGFAAPVQNPPKIVAIGLNYMDHASESKMEVPDTPLVFTKFSSSIISATDAVEIPVELTQEVDYEVELGIVIGKKAKNVSPEDAMDHVFGYTVINDVSARDLQFSDEQWVRGKSLDTFCPMGPVIVTADEISDPQDLNIQCGVNGKTLQDDNTKNMIFDVADLVSRLSHSFTLEPGDIIASGTPQGVGFSRKPPIYLTPGDTMRTWIEGIGELNNPVIEA